MLCLVHACERVCVLCADDPLFMLASIPKQVVRLAAFSSLDLPSHVLKISRPPVCTPPALCIESWCSLPLTHFLRSLAALSLLSAPKTIRRLRRTVLGLGRAPECSSRASCFLVDPCGALLPCRLTPQVCVREEDDKQTHALTHTDSERERKRDKLEVSQGDQDEEVQISNYRSKTRCLSPWGPFFTLHQSLLVC